MLRPLKHLIKSLRAAQVLLVAIYHSSGVGEITNGSSIVEYLKTNYSAMKTTLKPSTCPPPPTNGIYTK